MRQCPTIVCALVLHLTKVKLLLLETYVRSHSLTRRVEMIGDAFLVSEVSCLSLQIYKLVQGQVNKMQT